MKKILTNFLKVEQIGNLYNYSKRYFCNIKEINEVKKILKIKKTELIQKPLIYIAKSNNIIYNLSTEEFLFEHQKIKSPILFLYQNSSNVVIGKHQNPWKECLVENIREKNIKIASK